jgi:hypothetical protein
VRISPRRFKLSDNNGSSNTERVTKKAPKPGDHIASNRQIMLAVWLTGDSVRLKAISSRKNNKAVQIVNNKNQLSVRRLIMLDAPEFKTGQTGMERLRRSRSDNGRLATIRIFGEPEED